MIKKLRYAIKWMIAHFPGKKIIVFESIPDFSDNTRAVFDEMMRQGLNKKYVLYWWVSKREAAGPEGFHVKYLYRDSAWERMRFWWVTFRAKALICCNNFLQERHPWQKSFYLTHGTALKGLKGYRVPEGVSYMLVASEHVQPTMARDFHMLKLDF